MTEDDYTAMFERLNTSFRRMTYNLPIELNPDNLSYDEFITQMESCKRNKYNYFSHESELSSMTVGFIVNSSS